MRCWRSFTAAHDKIRKNHGTQKNYRLCEIAENPGIGWKADNIVRNDASDNIIIRSFGMIVLRIKPYEYLVEGKKDSLFTVSPETFELMYKSDESRKW